MILSALEKDVVAETCPRRDVPIPDIFGDINTAALKLLSTGEVHSLTMQGYLVKDQFLGEDIATAVFADAVRYHEEGYLRPAGMKSSSNDRWERRDIRGDVMMWVHDTDEKHVTTSVRQVLLQLDALRRDLNDCAHFNSLRMESQLALYPGNGTRYIRHRDAPVDSSSPTNGPAHRRLTVIYYANPGWKEEHGGHLRIFLPTGEMDIAPLPDRLLMFYSSWLEHEVLPSFAPRVAISSFFY